MPEFDVIDNTTGEEFIIEGDQPPSQAEVQELIGSMQGNGEPPSGFLSQVQQRLSQGPPPEQPQGQTQFPGVTVQKGERDVGLLEFRSPQLEPTVEAGISGETGVPGQSILPTTPLSDIEQSLDTPTMSIPEIQEALDRGESDRFNPEIIQRLTQRGELRQPQPKSDKPTIELGKGLFASMTEAVLNTGVGAIDALVAGGSRVLAPLIAEGRGFAESFLRPPEPAFLGTEQSDLDARDKLQESLEIGPFTQRGQDIFDIGAIIPRKIGEFIAPKFQKAGENVLEFTNNPDATAVIMTLPIALAGTFGFKGSKSSFLPSNKAIGNALRDERFTVAKLKKTTNALYDGLDKSGIILKTEVVPKWVREMAQITRDFNAIPDQIKNSLSVVNRMGELFESGGPFTWREINGFRDQLSNAAKVSTVGATPDNALAFQLLKAWEKKIDDATNADLDIPAGAPKNPGAILKTAKETHAQAAKSKTLEEMFDQVHILEEPMAEGMPKRVKALLKNKKKMRFFNTARDQMLLKSINKGSSGMQILNVMKKLGLNSTGTMSMAGIGAHILAQAVGGTAANVTFFGIGQVSKFFANKLAKKNFELANAYFKAGNDGVQIARKYLEIVPRKDMVPGELVRLIVAKDINLDTLVTLGGPQNAAFLAEVAKQTRFGKQALAGIMAGAVANTMEEDQNAISRRPQNQLLQ